MKPGSVVSAFRIQRVIAKGATSAVYEAMQMSLGRTVALRLLTPDHYEDADAIARFDERQRRAASLHHPNVVPLYEAGEWEGGRFVASRFVRGKTLATLIEEGSPPARGSLDSLRGALGAIHASGLAHGRVSTRNIIVDSGGTPYLADLGAAEGGSPEEDTRELEEILSALPERAPRRLWPALLVGAAAIAAVAVSIVLLSDGGSEEDPGFGQFGCSEDLSPNTPACTLVQTELDGRDLAMRRSGVIRGWEVRGASGGLALQVIRESKDGVFVAGFSQPESVDDAAPQSFTADIGVKEGDRIGILLTPGGSVGAAPPTEGSTIVRWDGGLTADTQAASGTPLEGELMVQADVDYGAKPSNPGQITGAEAASAPEGEPLAEISAPLEGGRAGRVVLVELPEGIAVEVLRGDTRLARLEIPDADPDGDVIGLEENCGGETGRGFCFRWRNPGEELALVHVYQVLPSGEIKLIG
ncbi:MAG: serine/threonine kinase PknH [Solirubrobacterales bacterium]|nr:serine/threonine kinase PknH [Solirubrobacterales bacterium]